MVIVSPHIKMTRPAIEWACRSSQWLCTARVPWTSTSTVASMTANVAIRNTLVTAATPSHEDCEAGYISSGMSGSQGPKTKIVNSNQGVTCFETYEFFLPNQRPRCQWL